jgi:predicted transposase/invertase (TIGR01784 family)
VSFDNVCKVLAEKYPEEFASWLLAEAPTQVKVLKTELSLEPIRADSVTFLQTANRILHIEFQTRTISNPPLPFRMLDYSVRLIRQYNVPVTQVVIFLQETNNEIAFTEEYVNETTTHRYRVLRMWELEPALFLDNPALLPLAPLTRTTSPQRLLSQVAQSVARISDRNTKQDIAAYAEILAGLKFEKGLIRQFLSEDAMQESVIYQDILQKGRREGQEQGKEQGKKEEAFRFLMRQLTRRFGEIDSSIIERIQVLSTEQLEVLGEEFVDFSTISDLLTLLEQQENN